MEVTVSSRHADVSEGLRATATEKIGRLDRFLDGLDFAEVHFSEEHNPRISDSHVCEVTIEGHGHFIRAKVAAADGYAAVDLAVEKLEHQLHKLKTRIVDRSQAPVRQRPRGSGPVAVLEEDDESERTLADEAYISRRGTQIVKKKAFDIAPMSVDEAADRMELLGHSFFLFTNADTERAAVLYRRDDGALGLIDQSAS
ncbi:MAG: ribosome-associated translation inhibitor RaiA [Actinomycetota bacterium]|nr:ribosome-associated translation inhibitor RaiA [Actinomycetota bacterium]